MKKIILSIQILLFTGIVFSQELLKNNLDIKTNIEIQYSKVFNDKKKVLIGNEQEFKIYDHTGKFLYDNNLFGLTTLSGISDIVISHNGNNMIICNKTKELLLVDINLRTVKKIKIDSTLYGNPTFICSFSNDDKQIYISYRAGEIVNPETYLNGQYFGSWHIYNIDIYNLNGEFVKQIANKDLIKLTCYNESGGASNSIESLIIINDDFFYTLSATYSQLTLTRIKNKKKKQINIKNFYLSYYHYRKFYNSLIFYDSETIFSIDLPSNEIKQYVCKKEPSVFNIDGDYSFYAEDKELIVLKQNGDNKMTYTNNYRIRDVLVLNSSIVLVSKTNIRFWLPV